MTQQAAPILASYKQDSRRGAETREEGERECVVRPKLLEAIAILLLLLSFHHRVPPPRLCVSARVFSVPLSCLRPLQAIEGELAVDVVDFHPAALGELTLEKLHGQRILDPLLDHALQGPGAVGRVVALGGDCVQRGGR